MPTTDDDCMSYARDCVRLAGLAKDPLLQEQLLNMAREWMAVAMHETKSPIRNHCPCGRPPTEATA
jgi:hypothetical protein